MRGWSRLGLILLCSFMVWIMMPVANGIADVPASGDPNEATFEEDPPSNRLMSNPGPYISSAQAASTARARSKDPLAVVLVNQFTTYLVARNGLGRNLTVDDGRQVYLVTLSGNFPLLKHYRVPNTLTTSKVAFIIDAVTGATVTFAAIGPVTAGGAPPSCSVKNDNSCVAYGITSIGNGGGGSVRLETEAQSINDPDTQWIGETMWVHTGEMIPGCEALEPWIEVGYGYGWPHGAAQYPYWATAGPCGHSYREQRIFNQSLGAVGSKHVYTIQIVNTSTDLWRIYFDFKNVGETEPGERSEWVPEINVGLESFNYRGTLGTISLDAIQWRDAGCCSGHWFRWTNRNHLRDCPPFRWSWVVTYELAENNRVSGC
jgi:hypothetical protein